jgi:hypothetical protein
MAAALALPLAYLDQQCSPILGGGKAMLLQRDVVVVALAFTIAASLYLVSFRDLMAVPQAAGVGHSFLYVGHL